MAVVLYALLLFMLINASMSEFHMLVAIVVMFNMLELILELLPNFSNSTYYSDMYRVRVHMFTDKRFGTPICT